MCQIKMFRFFLPKIEALIDKSIRRTIDPINIRGIVMDVTSGFDNDIEYIINMTLELLEDDEINILKGYVVENLISDRKKSFDKFGYTVQDLHPNRYVLDTCSAKI